MSNRDIKHSHIKYKFSSDEGRKVRTIVYLFRNLIIDMSNFKEIATQRLIFSPIF